MGCTIFFRFSLWWEFTTYREDAAAWYEAVLEPLPDQSPYSMWQVKQSAVAGMIRFITSRLLWLLSEYF